MRYEVRQKTSYTYAAPVTLGRHLLRMIPVDRSGQAVAKARLDVFPEPTQRAESRDFFGNHTTHVTLDRAHRLLTMTLVAEISVDGAEPPDPSATPPWERIRDLAVASRDLGPASPAHVVFPSRLVPRHEKLTAYAAQSFQAKTNVLAAALDLTRRIKSDFVYDPEATDVATPVEQAFAMRRGVCQDFAHIALAGLRGLGMPAAYVSGYLRTEPPPGKERLVGVDATHAWIMVWCGPAHGWVGLDPTNGVPAGDGHIVLAVGRDYADVSPIDGIVIAAGDHEMSVTVDVRPLGEIRSAAPPR